MSTKAERLAVTSAKRMLGPEWEVELTGTGKKHQRLVVRRDGEEHFITLARGAKKDEVHVCNLVHNTCRDILLGRRDLGRRSVGV